MAVHRPFLLLAAVTAASSKYPQLQMAFNEDLKDTLGQRLISDGEKSLDLLQGLLVHLNW